jgi:4-amino-4-deoxy-L-arabinose transferase-like glycosyltransferase
LPWWWYFQSLPLLLLPWLLWPPLWNGTRLLTLDKGLRFCISWVLPVFAAFSLISGKRLHYLLPLMPGVALIIARAVDGIETFAWQKSQRLIAGVIGMMSAALLLSPFLAAYWPWLAESAALSPLWGLLLALSAAGLGLSKANSPVTAAFTVCAGSVLTAIILSCAFFQVRGARYDMTAPSREIAALLAQNKALVYPGKYHGQYNFYGRLERGLMAIDIDHVTAWAQRHPEGFIVRVLKDKKQHPDTGAYSQYPYRNKTLAIMPSESFLVHHGNVNTRSANRN